MVSAARYHNIKYLVYIEHLNIRTQKKDHFERIKTHSKYIKIVVDYVQVVDERESNAFNDNKLLSGKEAITAVQNLVQWLHLNI